MSDTTTLSYGCRCGRIRGALMRAESGSGALVACHCRDCQAFAEHLGMADALDPRRGTAVWQTTPDRLRLDRGAEELAVLRFSEKGLLRWHSGFCRTHLANTVGPCMRFAGIPIAALPDSGAREILGSPIATMFCRYARPQEEAPRDSGILAAGFGVLRRHFSAALRGADRGPFFDDRGRPVATPRVLAEEERVAAYGS